MGMQAVSNYWIKTLRRYRATRLPAALVLAAAGFLVIAGLPGGRPIAAAGLALACLSAAMLFIEFRLLDDLATLPHDRRAHPDRVLVQADSLLPFCILLLACFLGNLALVAAQPGPRYRLTVFLALHVAALVWYGLILRRWIHPILGGHGVLAKYPVMVFLVSGASRDHGGLIPAMAMVYLAFAIYEVLHDHSLHAALARALPVEIALLFIASALMPLELLGRGTSMVSLQTLLAVAGALALGEIFGRRQMHLRISWTSYLVFVIVAVQIVTFTWGVRR